MVKILTGELPQLTQLRSTTPAKVSSTAGLQNTSIKLFQFFISSFTHILIYPLQVGYG
jgi:hypothetical protein